MGSEPKNGICSTDGAIARPVRQTPATLTLTVGARRECGGGGGVVVDTDRRGCGGGVGAQIGFQHWRPPALDSMPCRIMFLIGSRMLD